VGSATKPPLASGGWGFRPQTPELLLPSPVTFIFPKPFLALKSLLSKRNENNFEIAKIFCFCPLVYYLNSAQGTLANATGSDFSACINYNLYYIILEWRLVGPSPSLPPLAQTSSYATGKGTWPPGFSYMMQQMFDCLHKKPSFYENLFQLSPTLS